MVRGPSGATRRVPKCQISDHGKSIYTDLALKESRFRFKKVVSEFLKYV